MQTNIPNQLLYKTNLALRTFLTLFTLLMVFSCQKQVEELKRSIQINEKEHLITKTSNQKESKDLKLLLSLPNLNDSLKNAFNFEYYKYELQADGNNLWVIGLKHGRFGLNNAKAFISLQKEQLSILILSYDYNKASYIRGDFTTYTGTIGFYDKNVIKTKVLYYVEGILKPIISSGFTTLSLCGNCPPPQQVNWCYSFPQFCSTGGGGSNEPGEWQVPQPEDGGGTSTSYSPTVSNLIFTLSLPEAEANWLANNPSRAGEMENFLLNGDYSELTFEDKKRIAYDHLFNMMDNPDYLEMVVDYSVSVAVVHPWMIELFKELAIEIGFKIVKKYSPGYSDWNSIKEAIQNGSQGDWLGMLGEVINIAKKKVPWLAVVDATIDAFDFGTIANSAWKAFNKINRISSQAFDGIIKTLKNKCGGILDKIQHDIDKQGVIKYNPADAESFFREIASHIPGTTVHPTSSPGVFYFDTGGIRFTFYPISQTTGDASIALKTLTTNWEYKFRFYN